MHGKFMYGSSLLAACLALAGLSSALADTTTVTTRTVETGAPSSFILPPSRYVVVEPLTGTIRGDYMADTRTIDGMPLTSDFVVVDKASRKLVATFDANGNLIDISAAPAASTVIAAVDSHRIGLQNQIDSLLAQGKMTNNQAESLRGEIATLFPTTTVVTRTYENTLGTNAALLTVESHLSSIAPATYTTSTAPVFLRMNGQIILPDDLTRRKFKLERQMNNEFAAGRLTEGQFTLLKSDMSEIYNRESLYRMSGLMSDGDANRLSADLDAFQLKLDSDLSNRVTVIQTTNN